MRPFATDRGDLFRLNSDFVESYSIKAPPFGFNGLGELVFMRTYSRSNDLNQKESWYQTVERVNQL
jgi:ribonucleoside-triphosphate reductase (thioredoxin)